MLFKLYSKLCNAQNVVIFAEWATFTEITLLNIASTPRQIQITWKGQVVHKLSDQQEITHYLGKWFFMPEHKLTGGQWNKVVHTVTAVYR